MADDVEVIAALRRLRARSRHQRDFTAAAAAREAGISIPWLYRRYGDAFKAMRAEMPGSQPGDQAVVAEIRAENRRLRADVRRLEADLARRPTADDLADLLAFNEQFDLENRRLRSEVQHLRSRLDAAGSFIDIPIRPSAGEPIPIHASRRHHRDLDHPDTQD